MGANDRVPPELLSGSVDLLILKSLAGGERHRYAIARHPRIVGRGARARREFSLHRAAAAPVNGWVTDEWGASENNRRARYYKLTAAGRKHLAAQTREFDLVVTAIQRVFRTV